MITIKHPEGLVYVIKQTTLHGGVFIVDTVTGEIRIIPEALAAEPIANFKDGSRNMFIIILYHNPGIVYTNDDIRVEIPWGYDSMEPIKDSNGDTIIVIERMMNSVEYMNQMEGNHG